MSALKLYNQKFFLKLYGVRRSLCTAKRRVLEYPEEYPYPDEMEYDVQYAPYQANLKVCYHERLSLVTIYGYVVLPGELRGGYHDMYWRLQEALPDRFTFNVKMNAEGAALNEYNLWHKFSMAYFTNVTLEDYYSFVNGLAFPQSQIALNKVWFTLQTDETVDSERGFRESTLDMNVVDVDLGNRLTEQMARCFIEFEKKHPLLGSAAVRERYGEEPQLKK